MGALHSPSHDLGSRIEAVDAHIGAYPQIITLAGILAAYRHRIWMSVESKTLLPQVLNGLHRDITDCLHIDDSPSQMPAIGAWVYQQEIIAAARRARRA